MVLKDSQLPQLRNWQVGNTYKLEVEVEQLSLDAPNPSDFGDSKHWTGRFRIKSVRAIGGDNANSDTMDESKLKAEALKRVNKY